ncbi:MAG: lactonase family protein, partial [Bacteroides thetaiotaomicron]|nr:lactonase family protein [Bacteroides thetaiotaomicron]
YLIFLDYLEDKMSLNNTFIDKNYFFLYVTYVINQHPICLKGGGGIICAYKINLQTGRLRLISKVDACCPSPAYLSKDPTGKYLVCACHSGYSAATQAVQREDGTWGYKIIYDDAIIGLFSCRKDGSIGSLVDVAKHTTKVNGFLLHSRPHCAVWAPSGKFFVCCDKGDDHIYVYQINYDSKKLIQIHEPYKDDSMSAPRYCRFHPTKPFFVINHEGILQLTSFHYTEDGTITKVCAVSALPDIMEMPSKNGLKPGQKPSLQGLEISANGKYIYCAVNGVGIEGVAVLEMNQDNGQLELIQYQRVEGKWTRGLALSPDGKFLIVACMAENGLVTSFYIGDDGKLIPTSVKLNLPGAAFVTFCPISHC